MVEAGAPSFFTLPAATCVRAALAPPTLPLLPTSDGRAGSFGVASVTHEVVLFDGGAGVVETTVELDAGVAIEVGLSETTGATLLEWGNEIAAAASTADDRVAGLAAAGAAGAAQAALLPWFGVTLVATRAAGGPSVLRHGTLEDVVAGLTSAADGARPLPRWPGLLLVREGMGGLFAMLDGDVDGAERLRARVAWLWRLAVHNVARLWAVNRELAARTSALLEGSRRPERQLEALRREGVELEVAVRESSPVTVCADALEERVYGGLWDRWGGPAIAAEIREELEFLQEHFHQTASLLEARMQRRMAWILFLLNLAAFSTAIASLITTYDVRNDVFPPDTRVQIILAGTFGLLAVALLVVFLRPWDRGARPSRDGAS